MMNAPATLTADQASALQSLGFLYLQHGQLGRGLTLIILADRGRPGVKTIMRTLAYAYLKNGEPQQALKVITRIERVDGSIPQTSALQLLKAQALWLSGEKSLGRQVFKRFHEARAVQREIALSPDQHAALGKAAANDDELVLGLEDEFVLGDGEKR